MNPPCLKTGEFGKKVFVPNFEKPVTRAKTKKIMQLKGELSKLTINNSKKGSGKAISQKNATSDATDKSNNNALGVFEGKEIENPDPSKFVLTKWGDLTFLGRRKVPDEEMASPLFDGVTVNVESDEFAENEEEEIRPSTSRGKGERISDEGTASIGLGESAKGGDVLENAKLSAEEERLLRENPHFHYHVENVGRKVEEFDK